MSSAAVAIWVEPHLFQDAIFDPTSKYNRDNCFAWYRELRKALLCEGCSCHTQDVFQCSGDIPTIVLFGEIPSRNVSAVLGPWKGKSRPIALLLEGETICPRNWDETRHREFDYLFTWHTDYIGKPRYVELRYTFSIDPEFRLLRDIGHKSKLCTMIAGNKMRRSHHELYSKRVEAIQWFEKNHPTDFDLYGTGWAEPRIRGIGRLKRAGLWPIVKLLFPPESRPSYRGPVESKLVVYKKYRFAFCFENSKDIPGYITEKLFDAFIGSCVPIYWGAPDIADFVPDNCFIDFRQFQDFKKLYNYLVQMNDREYMSYIDNIENFLLSQLNGPFGARYSAQQVAKFIVESSAVPSRQPI